MVEKLPLTIPALSGKTPRNVYVYLPEVAKKNPRKRFPVLYMFDGHNVFFDEDATYGKSWGMKKYMDKNRTPMIIVAVECNHGKNNERLKEYSPFNFGYKNELRIVGKGEKYMDWLINTLKPITDENYPTLPDRAHTFIAGSSMGGLMSLYAVTKHNDVFWFDVEVDSIILLEMANPKNTVVEKLQTDARRQLVPESVQGAKTAVE